MLDSYTPLGVAARILADKILLSGSSELRFLDQVNTPITKLESSEFETSALYRHDGYSGIKYHSEKRFLAGRPGF